MQVRVLERGYIARFAQAHGTRLVADSESNVR
jgi:hypothetical protein